MLLVFIHYQAVAIKLQDEGRNGGGFNEALLIFPGLFHVHFIHRTKHQWRIKCYTNKGIQKRNILFLLLFPRHLVLSMSRNEGQLQVSLRAVGYSSNNLHQ